jgi:ATP-binding cassette subfamily F protein uup
MQYTPVEKLSGGEKRRLYLLTVLMKNPNFLILDEPTNDLDIQTLNILQEFLESYTGCVLIVSHDRYFMDTLADHLFIFEGNGVIRDYNGNYTDYRSELSEKEKPLAQAPRQESALGIEKPKNTAKPSFKEVHEFNQLDAEIPKLEEKVQQLTSALNSGISDHVELNRLGEELKTLSETLEEKTMRWLELSDKVNS